MRILRLICALALLYVAAQWLGAPRDPARAIEVGLTAEFREAATPGYFEQELTAAFASDDMEDAGLLLEAAALAEAPISPEWRERYLAETTGWTGRIRTARECGAGFLTGAGEGAAGLGCSVAADFTLVGDLRDLARELPKPEPNRLIVGLAAAGLALEVGTLASAGAVAPLKGAASTLKAAVRGARISPNLTRSLRTAAEGAVDINRLRRAASRGDGALARAAVDSRKLNRLAEPLRDVMAVRKTGGMPAVRQTLRHAEDLTDLKRAARVSKTMGARTAPMLRVLGDGALKTTRFVIRAARRFMAGILGALLALAEIASAVAAAGRGLGRGLFSAIQMLR